MSIARQGALWSAQAHMPTVSIDPIEIVRGEGSYIFTRDGQRLFDTTSGLWHANVGHGRRELAQTAALQMETLETYHVFGRFVNDKAIALAEQVADMAPIDDPKVFWTSGGSDSVDLACKLALRHWQIHGKPTKHVILSRDKAYHGLHGFGTSVAGLEPNRLGYGVDSIFPLTARVSNSDIESVRQTVAEIGAENIAALIAEPVMGTGGVLPPTSGYLEGLQQLCRANDILFIVDEVITGFGRTGRMFASERFGLDADMILVAKGITSGYMPLGGVIIASRVWAPYFGEGAEVFRHGLTYSGHATACAVAIRNLQIMEDEGLVERVAALEPQLAAGLNAISNTPGIVEVRTCGLLGGVQMDPQINGENVARRCIGAGVSMRVLTDNTLQICPPFITTDDELQLVMDTIADALRAELQVAA
jgi:adenosylmethionine-8-amino-7-oxononanoate aminotransferase